MAAAVDVHVVNDCTEDIDLNDDNSNKENERELNLVGHGKWKDINKNEL